MKKQEAPPPGWLMRAMDALGRRAGLWACLFVLIATARIVAVYPVYNHTIDEPAHIACGMEWLSRGEYKYESQHPPLARILGALLPYLDGSRTVGRQGIYNEGALILYSGNQYGRKLALARAGILPLFWLACLALYFWARRTLSTAEAALAVLLFTTMPPVLAHAGLATTDMGLTAGFAAACCCLLWWVNAPDWKSALGLGVSVALMVLSKFSALLFFPLTVLAFAALAYKYLDRSRLKAWTLTIPIALAVLALLVALIYRFNFEPLIRGLQDVKQHQAAGHPSYLLGSLSKTGFWFYYEFALAVKTPLAALALAIWGFVLLRRRKDVAAQMPLAIVLALLASGFISNINIGVRHILPVYLAFSIAGAVALKWLIDSPRWMNVAAVLLVLQLGAGVLAHPDYLPYTNLLAGSEPEKILADSDLDWGQDMLRLGARLRELNAPNVAFSPFIVAYLEAAHGFPPLQQNHPQIPAPGWNAVSITMWKVTRLGLFFEHPEVELWPDQMPPTERVGKGVLLYYVRPGSVPR